MSEKGKGQFPEQNDLGSFALYYYLGYSAWDNTGKALLLHVL